MGVMYEESPPDKIGFGKFAASGETSCSKPLSKYLQYGWRPCAYCSFFWQLEATFKKSRHIVIFMHKKTSHRKAMLAFKMVPIIGFELMTYRLQGGCSTN
jgi:hypothetical protein